MLKHEPDDLRVSGLLWQPIETIPDDRTVWVSNGDYVGPAYVDGFGALAYALDPDRHLNDATHWAEKTDDKHPPLSDGSGPTYSEAVYQPKYLSKWREAGDRAKRQPPAAKLPWWHRLLNRVWG